MSLPSAKQQPPAVLSTSTTTPAPSTQPVQEVLLQPSSQEIQDIDIPDVNDTQPQPQPPNPVIPELPLYPKAPEIPLSTDRKFVCIEFPGYIRPGGDYNAALSSFGGEMAIAHALKHHHTEQEESSLEMRFRASPSAHPTLGRRRVSGNLLLRVHTGRGLSFTSFVLW